MKFALLTRRPEENITLASSLARAGYEVLQQPLISFKPILAELQRAANAYSNFTLVITSKYAAEIIATNYPIKADCFVVGAASAKLLKDAGFNIRYIAPRAEQLFKELKNHQNEQLLYLRGSVITKETPSYIKEAVIYETTYQDALDKNIIEKISSGDNGIVFIFSIKTAQTFAKLIKQHELQNHLKKLTVITLSQAIASALSPLRVKTIFPPLPTAESVVDFIKFIK